MVGLSNVDNTSDINKPVSNATSALGGKANLTGPSLLVKYIVEIIQDIVYMKEVGTPELILF
jgi:hypothetical protein